MSLISWQPEDYTLFRKCGEVTISPDVQCLGFNCGFCASTCLKHDVFLSHLQDEHKEDVYKLYQIEHATLDGELLQLQVQLSNNEDLCMSWSSFDQQQMTCLTPIVNNEKIQRQQQGDVEVLSDSTFIDSRNLWSKTEMENLLETSNPLDCNSSTINSPISYPYSPTTTATPDDTIPLNDCEIGDGEDSGIVVAQTPCLNACTDPVTEAGGLCVDVCSGLSDCVSFNGDNSGKLLDTSVNSWKECTVEEDIYKYLENEHGENQFATLKNEKYLKTEAMRKALERREVIAGLLELYKTNEKLWNPENTSYKYNARRTVYDELSKPLRDKVNVHLSGLEIFGILNILRGRYRRELAKFNSRKGKHRTHLWYFDQMNFLRKIIEKKRRVRQSEMKQSCQKQSGPEDLTNRQVLSFLIDQYKTCECLWNPNEAEFGVCNKSDLFDGISVRLKKELNVEMGQKEIENEIQKLRIRYRKELRIFHKQKGLYIPKLWCYDELEFLRPIVEGKIIKNGKKTSRRIMSLRQKKNDFDNVKEIQFPGFKQQMQFIDIYRKYSSLWDVDHPDYRSTHYRNIAMQSMLKEVNLLLQPDEVSLEQLEKTLYQLRKDFSIEKLTRLRNKEDIINQTSSTMSLVVYEKLSAFLALNLGPFQCEECHHMSRTYDQYKIHKSKHDGALPFICTLCGKGFQMPGNLTIHIRRHRQDFPYSCETCNKAFATSTEVTIHMRSHTGERPYICDLCDKTFKTWSFFDIHKRTHLNQSNFHCPICDKSFYERNRFTDHMNVHLNIRKHQCEQCGKGYTTMSNLKKHQELHAPEKKYKCSLCGKCFAQFASLRWHKKTQHEDK